MSTYVMINQCRLLHISSIDRVAQENRMYWKLEGMLPKDEQFPVQMIFDIKHYTFTVLRGGFVNMARYTELRQWISSEWFEVQIVRNRDQTEFDVRVGIARESGKEMVVSKAEVLTPKKRTAVFRLIRRSELHKMLHTYRELEFFVAVDQKEEEKEEINKMDSRKFRTDYKELLLSGRYSDFTIHVKGKKFPVHKSILGARSPVFSGMMEHDMEEKRTGQVTLMDDDPAVFPEFLLFLYSGEEEHLDWKNIAELYTLADKYCVEDLRHLCVERMKTLLSIDNFFEIFHISQQLLPNSELSEIVIQFFLEDSKEIVGSEKHIEFMKQHPEETNVLMKALEANKQ